MPGRAPRAARAPRPPRPARGDRQAGCRSRPRRRRTPGSPAPPTELAPTGETRRPENQDERHYRPDRDEPRPVRERQADADVHSVLRVAEKRVELAYREGADH